MRHSKSKNIITATVHYFEDYGLKRGVILILNQLVLIAIIPLLFIYIEYSDINILSVLVGILFYTIYSIVYNNSVHKLFKNEGFFYTERSVLPTEWIECPNCQYHFKEGETND